MFPRRLIKRGNNRLVDINACFLLHLTTEGGLSCFAVINTTAWHNVGAFVNAALAIFTE